MIQYPKWTHVTLPSVDGAFGTLNILRDPPKSIHTRFIEKVGDTNRITSQIDDSADRACEAILPFARGVNPMVNVSYNNFGNNGGQVRYLAGSTEANSVTAMSNSMPQAKLPYRIIREGAFRPPIKPPQDLLPLSRLPRVATSQLSNPGSNQIIKQIECQPDMRAIRNELISVCAPSRQLFNIQQPLSQPYEVKYAVSDALNVMARTNVSDLNGNRQIQDNLIPTKGIDNNKTYTTVSSKAFKNVQQPLSDIGGMARPAVKDALLGGSYQTNVSLQGDGNPIFGQMKDLGRNLPLGSISTNAYNPRVDMTNQNLQRKYTYLPERRNRGSFQNGGVQQSFERPEIAVKLSNATSTKQKAYALSCNRF